MPVTQPENLVLGMRRKGTGRAVTTYVVMLVVVLLIGVAVLGILYSVLSRNERPRSRR